MKWVTDFILCIASPVKFGEYYPLSNKDLSNPRSLPRVNISPSDGGDESSDACVDGNMREAATPVPESVHQTHAGAPGCCVLTVTLVTCDNDNRPGSKLCVNS